MQKTKRKQMRKPRLTEEILRKLEYIDENKGPDGWTRIWPTDMMNNICCTLFEYNVDGVKVKLSNAGSFLLSWCR
jgi:hypothetical protein